MLTKILSVVLLNLFISSVAFGWCSPSKRDGSSIHGSAAANFWDLKLEQQFMDEWTHSLTDEQNGLVSMESYVHGRMQEHDHTAGMTSEQAIKRFFEILHVRNEIETWPACEQRKLGYNTFLDKKIITNLEKEMRVSLPLDADEANETIDEVASARIQKLLEGLGDVGSNGIYLDSAVRNQVELTDYYDTVEHDYLKARTALRLKHWLDVSDFKRGAHRKWVSDAAFFVKVTPSVHGAENSNSQFQTRMEYFVPVSQAEIRDLPNYSVSYAVRSLLERVIEPAHLEGKYFAHSDKERMIEQEQVIEQFFSKLLGEKLKGRVARLSQVAANRFGLDINLREGKKQIKVGFLTLDFFSDDLAKVRHGANATGAKLQYEVEILPEYQDMLLSGSSAMTSFLRNLSKVMPGELNLQPKYLQVTPCKRALE